MKKACNGPNYSSFTQKVVMSSQYFILVIEDDLSLVQLLSEFFSSKGYHVDIAQKGAEAIDKLNGHVYDLLLIDLKLPDMNGIELVKWVKDNSPDTITVILSGHATIEMTLEAISLGAFDFLIKPVQLARLNIVVENGLERRKIILQNKKLIQELQIAKKDLEARIRQRTEQLKKSENKFRSLYDKAPDVYYTVNTRGQIIDCNKMATEFFGTSKRKLKAMHLLDLYTSEYFELVSKMVPTPDGKGGKVRHQEVKVKRGDGSIADVEINSNLLFDDNNKVIGALTIQRNITARKKAEERLRESEERYRTIFQTAEVGLIEMDYSHLKSTLEQLKDQGINNWQDYAAHNPEFARDAARTIRSVDINNAGIKLFKGETKEDLLGPIHRFFVRESYKSLSKIIVAIASGHETYHEETVLQTLQGEKIHTLVSLSVPIEKSELKNMLVSVVDISERKKVEEEKDLLLTKLHHLNKQLETLAITDGLTRLYNHRFFMENLNREFSRAQRLDQPLSLLIADIDDFKNFNDTYGHHLGDEILFRVAEVFGNSRRGSDIVARYGGEEFVLLLPDTTLDKALLLAEKLRQNVEKTAIESPEGNLKVTVSLGAFAMDNNNLPNPKELLIMADKGLYMAKKGGKNKVCSAVEAGEEAYNGWKSQIFNG